jgi:hypothetical protein
MPGQTSRLIIDKAANNTHISFHDTHQSQRLKLINAKSKAPEPIQHTSIDHHFASRLLTKPYRDFPIFTRA